jgi:hypothetical protein
VSSGERVRVEEALRHIDELVSGLSHIADPAGHETARELVSAVLDLHGLALARIMAIVAEAAEGPALLDRLAADEQVKAVLLLYGLHPDDAATRVRDALDRLRPRLAAAGVAVERVHVSGHSAVVRVSGAEIAGLRDEIEEAVVNAAPDLDDIAIECVDPADVAQNAAAAE